MRSEGFIAFQVKRYTFPERGERVGVKTNMSDEFAKKQVIHLEGMKGSFECIPASQSGVIFPASCVSTVVPDQQPLSVRSEFIKLCLVHAFCAIRVGELFEIGFPLMNGSAQLLVTIRFSPSTRG